MKLYDDLITSWNGRICSYPFRRLPVLGGSCWPDDGDRNMILGCDMAYELGGGNYPALGGTVITDKEELAPEDEILLCGPDLPEIREDMPYARLAVVRVKEGSMGDGDTLYNAIRRIEYTRYHVNPRGFMMRISSVSEREAVRVGAEALAEGLDFSKAGSLLLDSFHRNPKVEAVRLIFVTLQDFPYRKLEQEIRRAEKITKAIDHILKNAVMDCKTCSLQEVCDEVEGLKELHFAR